MPVPKGKDREITGNKVSKNRPADKLRRRRSGAIAAGSATLLSAGRAPGSLGEFQV
jgi:hypothetical protein